MNTELVELERHRLDALRQCNVLDTPRESSFDGIVFTAAQVDEDGRALVCAQVPAKLVGQLPRELPTHD